MRRIFALAMKEFRQISRDPFSLLMLLGVPTFMLLLYGFALNFDVRHILIAVQDRDRSAASRTLVSSFVNSGYFDLAADLPADADLESLTERREARAILVIPEGYSRDLAAGRRTPVQILLDGTDAMTATTVIGYAESIVAAGNIALLPGATPGRSAADPPIDYRPRVWYNPELKSTQFIVPGLIGFILMLTAVLSTALSLVREKERGTIEQLHVSPLHPGQIILGKTLPYLLISLAATTIILVVARLLFGVVVRGSYEQLFVVVLVYLLGALALGLLVSSIARTQTMAFQIGALISMLPAIFLSGFIFPIRSMPVVLQAITFAVPARYFLVILRGIVLKGAGLEAYWRDMIFLSAFAVIVMGLAWFRLTRRDA